MISLYFGQKYLVEELIEKGAFLDWQDLYGNTALHYAVRRNRKTLVKVFVQQGANLTLQNEEGKTPADIDTHKLIVTLANQKVMIAFFNNSREKFKSMSHMRYDNASYRAYCEKSPLSKPEPDLEKTVTWLVSFLTSSRLIPPPFRSSERAETISTIPSS